MIAGMNERITFQKQDVIVDDIGNHTNKWSDYYSCWAAIATSRISTKEKEEAAQTLEQERLDFTVRYCPQVSTISSTEYRIAFKGHIYNIDKIDNVDFKKKTLKFSASLVRR